MMRCLRDMNMSKFVAEDVPLFLSLIDDLFPSLKADRASFPEISAALEKVSCSCTSFTACKSQSYCVTCLPHHLDLQAGSTARYVFICPQVHHPEKGPYDLFAAVCPI